MRRSHEFDAGDWYIEGWSEQRWVEPSKEEIAGAPVVARQVKGGLRPEDNPSALHRKAG